MAANNLAPGVTRLSTAMKLTVCYVDIRGVIVFLISEFQQPGYVKKCCELQIQFSVFSKWFSATCLLKFLFFIFSRLLLQVKQESLAEDLQQKGKQINPKAAT